MPQIKVKNPATADTLLQILRYRNYPASLLPLRQGSAFSQVVLGPFPYRTGPAAQALDKQRPVSCSLIFVNDVLKELKQPLPQHSDMLQFHLQFPFEVKQEFQGHVLRLLTRYNGFMPFGQFILTDEQKVAFRYHWHLYERDMDGLILLEIIETLLFFVESLGYRIEAIAQGTRTLAEVLKQDLSFRPPQA